MQSALKSVKPYYKQTKTNTTNYKTKVIFCPCRAWRLSYTYLSTQNITVSRISWKEKYCFSELMLPRTQSRLQHQDQ